MLFSSIVRNHACQVDMLSMLDAIEIKGNRNIIKGKLNKNGPK